MDAFFISASPLRLFFYSVTCRSVCFAFYGAKKSRDQEAEGKVFGQNTTHRVEIVNETALDLAHCFARDTFATEKLNRTSVYEKMRNRGKRMRISTYISRVRDIPKKKIGLRRCDGAGHEEQRSEYQWAEQMVCRSLRRYSIRPSGLTKRNVIPSSVHRRSPPLRLVPLADPCGE